MSWKDFASLQQQAEQLEARAEAICRPHAERGCDCDLCRCLNLAVSSLGNAADYLADAASNEREHLALEGRC